jgi:hypothetical protein
VSAVMSMTTAVDQIVESVKLSDAKQMRVEVPGFQTRFKVIADDAFGEQILRRADLRRVELVRGAAQRTGVVRRARFSTSRSRT